MKTAIVTGASSGMGRECVIQLVDRFGGIEEIWAIARRHDRLEELAKELPVPMKILPFDLTDPAGLSGLEAELKRVRPQVRILVNAAGCGRNGRIGSAELKQETGMVRLNCEALCAVTHLVLPYMADHSRILQFASAAAFLPQPDFGIYAATKAFVLSYSRALHEELRSRDIAVTAVCPGPVRTEFLELAGSAQAMPSYKRYFLADPKRVVKKAIRDSMAGRPISVYGLSMQGFRFACRLIPQELLLRIQQKL